MTVIKIMSFKLVFSRIGLIVNAAARDKLKSPGQQCDLKNIVHFDLVEQ